MSMIVLAAAALSVPGLDHYEFACVSNSCTITSPAIAVTVSREKEGLEWDIDAFLYPKNTKASIRPARLNNFRIAPKTSSKARWAWWYTINRDELFYVQRTTADVKTDFSTMMRRLGRYQEIYVATDYACDFDVVCDQILPIKTAPLLRVIVRARASLRAR